MDSLLASYASSDEEEEEIQPPSKPSSSSSLFSSLPAHGSASNGEQEASKAAIEPSSIFSNLALPKPRNPSSDLSSSLPNPKRVVQFRPPINPYSLKSSELNDEDDDEEEDRERERRRWRDAESSSRGSSVKSFLSAIPAPKNSVSLGALPSSGSGRRAIIETEVLPSNSAAPAEDNDPIASSNSAVDYEAGADWNSDNNAQFYAGSFESGSDQPSSGSYGYHESYSSGFSSGDGSSTGGYAGYGSYGVEASAIEAMETPSAIEIAMKGSGKRGRSEIPMNIIEVKQDELMKNRPREDQAKSTGIAFGPSYEPASTKGKPSKLHKRKHQIGSLYFDMKSKESELAERRSRGFLTKAETHAKYGW